MRDSRGIISAGAHALYTLTYHSFICRRPFNLFHARLNLRFTKIDQLQLNSSYSLVVQESGYLYRIFPVLDQNMTTD